MGNFDGMGPIEILKMSFWRGFTWLEKGADRIKPLQGLGFYGDDFVDCFVFFSGMSC